MKRFDEYHPLVKRLLDGELSLGELPPELRPEGESALRMLSAADRDTPPFSAWFDQRVMAEVRRRPAPGRSRVWTWLNQSRQIRIRPRLALLGAAAFGVAALLMIRLSGSGDTPVAVEPGRTYVRFVVYAPDAHRVALAGSFNGWDAEQTQLVPTGSGGFWTATVALPSGQHLYGFVLDGGKWIADPGAPAVDDGFGRRNSVITVTTAGAATS